jgi:Ala-tRNA(Pro) deacylase
MNGQKVVYDYLENLGIQYEYLEHPPAPTIEIAKEYWKDLEAVHCKNLFFRNHKGNRHYLVVFNCDKNLVIKDLEQRLKQGKLSFASEKRMDKYLGLKPGSVSPFGLINDEENHVHVFFDKNLLDAERISFHPNENTASLTISQADFIKYIDSVGNSYEFIDLY